jgi:predicted dehydrogenase
MKSLPIVRVGVIGLGQIAVKAHLPGYSQAPGCQITAIHSMREQHAKDIAKQFGVPHIYKNVDRLLEAKDVDAVSICTPNFTHAEIAIKALKHGKHVLVEKPMAINSVEAKAMIQAAKKYKRILMVHQNMRFDPAIRTAKKLLDKGIIGDIFAVKSSLTHKGPQAWSQKANWFFDKKKSGGGALMDLGPHVFDSLSFILSDEAVLVGAVAADGRKVKLSAGMAPVQTDVHTACLLRFRKGAIGMINVGWADNAYHNRFYFYGSKGVMSINLGKGEPITVEYRNKPQREFPDLDKGSFSPTIYENFLDCIRKRKTPMVSGEEGLKTIELVEAGYRFISKSAPDVF